MQKQESRSRVKSRFSMPNNEKMALLSSLFSPLRKLKSKQETTKNRHVREPPVYTKSLQSVVSAKISTIFLSSFNKKNEKKTVSDKISCTEGFPVSASQKEKKIKLRFWLSCARDVVPYVNQSKFHISNAWSL